MLPAKLIIVEGLPGLGKSTRSQHLAIEFEKRGIPCRWYYEAEFDNPVSGYYEPQFYASPPVFIEEQTARWRRFAEACAHRNEITILESSLFQETIFGLLQYNVPQAEIRRFVCDIVDIITPLRPVVVYLYHAQPGVAIQHACEVRGPAVEELYVARNDDSPFARRRDLFGFLGLARFWAEHKLIADDLYDGLTFRKLRLDITHGHTAAHHQRLLAFLGLPAVADQPVSLEYLHRFTGAYAYHRRAQRHTFDVSVRDAQLLVRDCPCLWVENRLIPRDLNAFYAESWPYLVVFEERATGDIAAMRVDNTDRTGRRVREVFEKVF
jgi:hypothetical protein